LNRIIEEADKAIENFLELKQTFKKLECNLPDDCGLIDYSIWMETGVYAYDAIIEFLVSPHYKCYVHLDVRLSQSLETLKRRSEAGIKKFKPLYNLAQYFGIEKDKDSKLLGSYEDLVYTINRLVEFLRYAKEDAKKNLELINKEVC